MGQHFERLPLKKGLNPSDEAALDDSPPQQLAGVVQCRRDTVVVIPQDEAKRLRDGQAAKLAERIRQG
ncbi:hypothetical protein OV207_01850 [Corallococcus sp. BB11-1]|uniref:hypothetical protein n=1 Tax=Corallococcus sp. BB11-1 TaxID=2996783 RepID=UPI00226FF2A5|nr:hypothetical protein [Corallococcus sp. BB11-1]MCY1030182.1 hypothetical protein [Corallococcus sp. BB11-1]